MPCDLRHRPALQVVHQNPSRMRGIVHLYDVLLSVVVLIIDENCVLAVESKCQSPTSRVYSRGCFRIGPIDLGLSPVRGSTRKSHTDSLMSDGEMISTSAYSPKVSFCCGVTRSHRLPGMVSTLVGMVSSSCVTVPVGPTLIAPTMRTAWRSSTRTITNPDCGECAPCLPFTALEPPVSTVMGWVSTGSVPSSTPRER